MWFGWSGKLIHSDSCEVHLESRDGVEYATTALQSDEFHRYYNGFSNGALWPLLHHMPSRLRFRAEEYAAYDSINRKLASRLAPLLEAKDVVWIHDYHLIPLGRHLRALGVRNPLGFFLHIPFPYIDTLRVLPNYAELVRDVASYDLVGLQTPADLRSFQSALDHVFGEQSRMDDGYFRIGDHSLRCDVFPIGVDVDHVQEDAVAAAQSDEVRRMVTSLLGRRLVIGVDRLDYSKGLPERFASYEHFLQQFPDNHGRLTYLQIAPVSRKEVASYVEIRRELERAAGRTNGRFGDTNWTPIRYLNRDFPHQTLMGFFRAAHIGLVTPLRDGMNLVAKEFVAAQDPDDPGVLILSTLAGAACEMTAAVQINPYDPSALGLALQSALSMPLGERRERHAQLLIDLRMRSIHRWVDSFTAALRAGSLVVGH